MRDALPPGHTLPRKRHTLVVQFRLARSKARCPVVLLDGRSCPGNDPVRYPAESNACGRSVEPTEPAMIWN